MHNHACSGLYHSRLQNAAPSTPPRIYSPIEPRGVVAWLQRPLIAVAALSFLALNTALVPFGHLLPKSLSALNLKPYMLGTMREWNDEQWPSIGQWYIVDDPSSPRFVPTDSGSFEDWELPFTSRVVRIYSVNTSVLPRVRGVWSPVGVEVEYQVRIRVLVRGEEGSEATQTESGANSQSAIDRALELFVANMVSIEGEHKALRTLKPVSNQPSSQGHERVWSSGPVIFPRWRGLINDAFVLIAGTLAAISLTGWRTWKLRRDARMLRANKCPGCGYGLAGLRDATCPECGAHFVQDE